ncbi:MAG: MOSC domain-containing protein [Bacteroidota bacterium]
MTGRLVQIWTAASAGAEMRRQRVADVVAGRGIVGDRYANGVGSFSRWPQRGREVSLIAAEALAEAAAEFGVSVREGQHRRNLVVEGVPLADLRGVPFRIGDVVFEGVRLCAPCRYLVRVTGQEEIFDALVRRGGLRATVVSAGVLRVGDAVTWNPDDVTRRRHLPG